jgi:hypothetical protein
MPCSIGSGGHHCGPGCNRIAVGHESGVLFRCRGLIGVESHGSSHPPIPRREDIPMILMPPCPRQAPFVVLKSVLVHASIKARCGWPGVPDTLTQRIATRHLTRDSAVPRTRRAGYSWREYLLSRMGGGNDATASRATRAATGECSTESPYSATGGCIGALFFCVAHKEDRMKTQYAGGGRALSPNCSILAQ